MALPPVSPGDEPVPNSNEQNTERNQGTVIGSVTGNVYVGQPGSPPGSYGAFERSTLPEKVRIFLSYKRGTPPDELVALDIYEVLRKKHQVFLDREMPVGTPWVERITQEIFQSHVLIVLLSEHSVQSEMVQREIELARQSAAQRQGWPIILPVRLAYRAPFRYPLNEYLDPLQWAFWDGPEETERLIAELCSAMTGEPLSIDTEAAKRKLLHGIDSSSGGNLMPPDPMAQPPGDQTAYALTLEPPEGTMAPDSQFYIQRESDGVALAALQRQGGTVTVLGPRQMGKSSLLFRTMAAAREQGKRMVFLDFQQFEQATLLDADIFFRRFCEWLTRKLRLSSQVEEFWQKNKTLGNPLRCTYYIEDYLLAELGTPLFLAMDEVDKLIKSPFRDEFFGMVRSWCNERADLDSPWRQCDLVMVTSTEPYQLIQDMDQSPFNVGTTVDLRDFTIEEVTELNQRHGLPLKANEVTELMGWVNGHPYLVRKGLYLVASGQMTATEVFATAVKDRGPFGGHLQYHLLRMEDKDHLVQGFLQVIRSHTCGDEQVLRRLEGAGLVKRGERRQVLSRCRLYAEYFKEHLRE